MKRRAGQAGRIFGEAFHQIGNLILVLFSLLLFGICLVGLRLSSGPLQVPHLASALATAVSGEGITVELQTADLAWAGYHEGGGVPLYLRLGGIAIRNKEGRLLATIPKARLLVVPSALFGSHAPILVSGDHAKLAGSDVPVSLRAAIRLDSGFKLSRANVQVVFGAGRLGAGQMSLPIESGGFTASFTPHTVTVEGGMLVLTPLGKSAPRIGFSGNARLGNVWQGNVTLIADAVNAADLAAYWPPELAHQTRRWVTTNIIAGTASDGVFNLGLTAPPDLAAFRLVQASGSFTGNGLTLIWLDQATPITRLNGRMLILDRNDALVTADSASLGGLALSNGRLKITGMSEKLQTGFLSLNVNGTVQDTLAVLNGQPINLLAHAPPGLAAATGSVAAKVSATIPFLDKLPFAKVDLHVGADLTDAALASPVQGLNFSQGGGRLDATGQGMKLAGRVMFAGQLAMVTLRQSFTGDNQNITLRSQAGPVLFHRLGLDKQTALMAPMKGSIPYIVTISGDPEAEQSLLVSADLTPASFSLPGFGWAKPAGQTGRLNVRAHLNHGAFAGFATISAKAPGLNIQTRLMGTEMVFSAFDIGGTEATGELDPPHEVNGVWLASFSGPVLDVRASGSQKSGAKPPPPGNAPPSGPPWRLKLSFARLRLAPRPAPDLIGFSLDGSGIGDTPLRMQAMVQGVVLTVAPLSPIRRSLGLNAADAGILLKATGAYGGVQGGTLTLNADYGGTSPISGTARLEKFRVLQAPVFAKVLQGLTLYGAPQAASGPGLLFSHAVIPFSIDHHVVQLNDARAYSASLGFTATGSIALASGDADLNATIVPAYAFNALPGKIPLIGRLFTAEKGGGLFAIRAKITGPLSDPKVSANPLSALTPGALRGVFGLHKAPPN